MSSTVRQKINKKKTKTKTKKKNKHGGGVGMYVNQSYQFTERADLSRNLDSVMDAQFIELNYKPSYILIGVIYRPPKVV